jgi:hypothetical protein
VVSAPMTPISLPPEDLPPDAITDADANLRRQLELTTRKHFFEACEGSIQSLLMEGRWIINMAEVPMLVIYCPNALHNWRVLSTLVAIARVLAQFSPQAKIRVYPPNGSGSPFEMRIDERSVYRDGQHQR